MDAIEEMFNELERAVQSLAESFSMVFTEGFAVFVNQMAQLMVESGQALDNILDGVQPLDEKLDTPPEDSDPSQN